jgi:co-chaperonin GroES (HSP10)
MGQYKGIAAEKSLDGLKMYADNVLVLMDYHRDARKESTSEAGIVLPQQAKRPRLNEAVFATVVQAGPGAHVMGVEDNFGVKRALTTTFHACPVKAGDRVVVDQAVSGQPVTIGGVEHRIVRQHNIIGVVEEGDAA